MNIVLCSRIICSIYASVGDILISSKIADGISDNPGHVDMDTHQVCPFSC